MVAAGSLADVVRTSWGAPVNLRSILVHMIEETARHNGHADVIREAIDGATGH
ncbi:mycothiol transferase [Micromonospora sp. IBHARD004]|uniref:mycothiol transferase n=1 Tax=Micromonospora sp. IBHARD004 TaxID=3457764 RepID=UPI00405A2808